MNISRSPKKKAFLIISIILLAVFISFFLIGMENKNDEISILITNLKSIKPEVSQKAEKRLVEMGETAVEPLRRAYLKEVINLKCYESMKAFTNVFRKEKPRSKPKPKSGNVPDLWLAFNPWADRHPKKEISKKSGRQLFAHNIIRIKNTLSQLGDRNSADQGVITSILDCTEYSRDDYLMAQELIKFFKYAGRSSIRPLMEQQRGEDLSSQKSAAIRIFMLEAVDEKSMDMLLHYLQDKDNKVRACAADLLGYTEDKIPGDKIFCMSMYPFRDARIDILDLHLNSGIGGTRDDFIYDENDWDPVRVMQKEFNRNINCTPTDPHEILAAYQRPFKDNRAVEPLLEALKDPDSNVKLMAIRSLGLIGDKRAVVPISEFLDRSKRLTQMDDAFYFEKEAIIALGLLGDKRGTKPLMDYSRNYWKIQLSFERANICNSINSLGMMRDPEAADYLIDIIESKYERVFFYESKLSAILALGYIRDKRAVVPLITMLEKQTDIKDYNQVNLSNASAFSLGLIGDKRALKPLKTAFINEDLDSNIIEWAIGEIEK